MKITATIHICKLRQKEKSDEEEKKSLTGFTDSKLMTPRLYTPVCSKFMHCQRSKFQKQYLCLKIIESVFFKVMTFLCAVKMLATFFYQKISSSVQKFGEKWISEAKLAYSEVSHYPNL